MMMLMMLTIPSIVVSILVITAGTIFVVVVIAIIIHTLVFRIAFIPVFKSKGIPVLIMITKYILCFSDIFSTSIFAFLFIFMFVVYACIRIHVYASVQIHMRIAHID